MTDTINTADLDYVSSLGGHFCKVYTWRYQDRTKAGKVPIGGGWQNKLNNAEQIRPHIKSGGNVGLICGKHSNNLGLLDADENFSGFCSKFPDLAAAPTVVRDGADKGKILIRIVGEIPRSKKWKHNPDDPPFFEFLSTGNQGVIPPSIHPTGVPYRWINAENPVPELTAEQLSDICYAWTGEGLDQPKKERPKTTGSTNGGGLAERVKAAWTPLDVFSHFGWVGETQLEKHGQEIRILGHGGLFVNAEGKSWNYPGDGKGKGGDSIDAWHYCKTGNFDTPKGQGFYELICEMGEAAGVEIPKTPHNPNSDETQTEKRHTKSAEYIQTLHNLGFEFAMNKCSDRVEVNHKPITDALEADIFTKLRDSGYPNVHIARDAYIAHAFHNSYHPVRDYLDGLVYDGGQYITRLVSCFDNPDGTLSTWLKRWLIGAVRRIYEPGEQNRVLVLDGPQNIGKSKFAEWIVPAPLRENYYIASPIYPDEKDCRVALVERWIWELAEMGSTTRKADREALKFFISLERVTWRPAYGRYEIQRPAMSNFIGTVNNEGGLLSDPTGNRRFMFSKITSIDWPTYTTELQPDSIWAEAKHLYFSGEPADLTITEIKKAAEINDAYEVDNPLEGILRQHFEVDPAHKDWWTSSAEILHWLGEREYNETTKRSKATYQGTTKAASMELSTLMTKLGCERQRRHPGWGYLGVQKSI